MDDRLIFLYCAMSVINVVGTEKDMRATYRMVVQASRRSEEVKSLWRLRREVMRWSRKAPEDVESMLPRKSAT